LSDLLDRSNQHEDVEIECKLAQGGLPRDLWETVSAFANSRGGRIVLGVNERRGFAPEGVSNVDARRKELWAEPAEGQQHDLV
jgi:ATP-dependent DNA helicase RecG